MLFSIAGRLNRKNKISQYTKPLGKFAVLIPAYKEDNVLVSTVQKCLAHNYPKDKFDIIVLDNDHQPATLIELAKLPITNIKVDVKKGEAIEKAINTIQNDYDFALILDADNVMEKDCMLKMNEKLQSGALVIQGHRKSKNKTNSVEILDSLSEEINNHIFRKGQRAVGLSSALIGSGMGFRYDYLKTIMQGMEGTWEDREMELRILRDRVTIEYLDDAIIFDEKTSSSHVFLKQRTKWVSGQIKYLKRTFEYCKNLKQWNANLVNKLAQSLCPPRSLLLGTIVLFWLLSLLIEIAIPQQYWLLLLSLYIVSLLIAIPAELFNRELFKAIIKLPYLVLLMFLVVPLSFRKGKPHFHTPHVYK